MNFKKKVSQESFDRFYDYNANCIDTLQASLRIIVKVFKEKFKDTLSIKEKSELNKVERLLK